MNADERESEKIFQDVYLGLTSAALMFPEFLIGIHPR
jgi:hypothetical protein